VATEDELFAEGSLHRALDLLEEAETELGVAAIFLGPYDPLGADALWLADALGAEVAAVATTLARLKRRASSV
jgi:hypothetical protein